MIYCIACTYNISSFIYKQNGVGIKSTVVSSIFVKDSEICCWFDLRNWIFIEFEILKAKFINRISVYIHEILLWMTYTNTDAHEY